MTKFTIRDLMIAICAAAGLCVLLVQLRSYQLPLWWMVIPCLFFLLGRWLWSWGAHRLAGVGFAVVALLANLLYTGAAIYPDYMLTPLLQFAWLALLLPLTAALGVAWASLATSTNAAPRRWPFVAWSLVVLLAVMPAFTLATLWPLHLAFLAFRPALERLADRVDAGHEIVSPQWVGPFCLTASASEPDLKIVGLFTDGNPNGRSGFVRVRSRKPEDVQFQLLIGTDIRVDLGRGWTYRQDD